MNISPIMNYSYNNRNYIQKSKKENNISFKAELSNKDFNRVLKMLTSCLTEVKECKNFDEFISIIKKLTDKCNNSEANSIGIMPIVGKELSQLVTEKKVNIDLRDKLGFFIATGDIKGPVETWNKAYESVLAILPKSELGSTRPTKVILISPGPKGIN